MIRATIRFILLVSWILFSTVLLWLLRAMGKKKWCERFNNFICAIVCKIIGLRVCVEGELASVRPLMMVSNHISYLDILIIGWKTPARFTPKSDMAKWPVISTICRLNNSVFIERTSRKIKKSRAKIHDALVTGSVLSLFPEGTTGNGRHIMPFKSSLFSIAEDKIMTKDGEKELFIQPAIISYTSVGGLPIDSTQWPIIAWYGDMVLLPHIWQLLKLGRIDAKLIFLPPVTLAQFGDRKQLAVYCHDVVEDVLQGR